MADDDVPEEADEVSDDELEEADEESFPASDPPATWSGPEENSTRPCMALEAWTIRRRMSRA